MPAPTAILVPCSLTLLSHTFREPGERARAVGLWAAGASTALSAGPLIGGVLTSALGWRAIFFINAPIGLFAIVATIRWATETPRVSDRGVNLWGQAAAIVAVTAAIALLAAVAFVAIEARRRRPMLPLSLFRSRTFSAASAIGLLVNIAFYGLIFVLSLFFQRGEKLSALQTGLAFAPMTVAVMAANLLAGRAAARCGPRLVIAAGGLLMASWPNSWPSASDWV